MHISTPGAIANAIAHHELISDSTLHVVAVISNPARYHSRYRLFRKFEAQMLSTPNVQLHVVELAVGDRHFEVTHNTKINHLQLRSNRHFWHKEAMINAGVRHLLPRDWRYVAWVDADVSFHTPGWALDTIHELQHTAVVQPWGECVDLGPKGEAMQMFRSFGQLISKGIRPQSKPTDPYAFGHPGYAWACTRAFWEEVGGLMDWAALGSADSHMAWAMIGKVNESYHKNVSDGFKARCHAWEQKAMLATGGQIGYVPGLITHDFHGPKSKRYYRERWQILVDFGFDPNTDVRHDAQGMPYIHAKADLEREIMRYMMSRNEDSIDV